MNKVHVVKQDGGIVSPFLTKFKPTYAVGDKLIIEAADGTQTAFDIDYVADAKVNKGWCYLTLHGLQGVPLLTEVNDIPESVGGGHGIHPEEDGA